MPRETLLSGKAKNAMEYRICTGLQQRCYERVPSVLARLNPVLFTRQYQFPSALQDPAALTHPDVESIVRLGPSGK
jgi:hypothetical protein